MSNDREAVLPARELRAIIACSIFQPELEQLLAGRGEDVRIIYVEQGMHRTPHHLPERIQHEVDRAAQWAEQIVLCYGLCCNGIVGVTAPKQGLVVTKAHDCVALFLGSIQEYNRLSRQEPGTYFLTPGWIKEDKDPLGQMEREYEPKLGRELAEWGAKEELKHYSRFVLIRTSAGDYDELRSRSRENAEFFGKEHQEVQGDLNYLQKILFGPYDGRYFYLLEPGQRIQQNWFLRDSA